MREYISDTSGAHGAVFRFACAVLCVAMSLFMSSRALYTSPDDLDYLNAFARFTPLPEDLVILSEPLWLFYSQVSSSIFDAETCLRITIFLANFLFLYGFLRLSRWEIGYVAIVFIFNLYLATLFYYIQIRVGLAIGAFLFMIAFRIRPLLAAFLCATIHASFIFVAAGIVLGFIFRSHQVFRISGVVIGLFGIAILSSAVDAGEVLASLSLGRRDGVYAPERISNLNFYVVSVVMFVLSVPYAVRWIKRGDVAFPFTSGILAFYLLAVAASFLNEAGTRLVAMANIFAMVHLGAMRGNIRYYAMWMIAVFQILLVGNEFIKGNFGPDSWFFRWVMILS